MNESKLRKGKNASVSNDHVSNITDTRPLPAQTSTQVPAMGLAAPVVTKENWVYCGAFEKWHLLLVGIETSSLPKMVAPLYNLCDVRLPDLLFQNFYQMIEWIYIYSAYFCFMFPLVHVIFAKT